MFTAACINRFLYIKLFNAILNKEALNSWHKFPFHLCLSRILKISSPKLNYLIIIGSYWLYINVYFFFPNKEEHQFVYGIFYKVSHDNTDSIIIQKQALYFTTVSFSLCDGTIQGKMFRIFYIFHNPSPKKKVAHVIIYANDFVINIKTSYTDNS